ncbi:hypothetical protein [Paenibacillus xylanilyticus]|uniref:LPS export ABC transporter periplasmic protein LptC n=1 Tax=Paenibacillus xylanilyticus TaxID=248903 RepID=A0A7Y6BY19_9BACL|nr:hypothetical protein [Paenibacillus xylanilyticus]NUU77054.1 hypothetical protein [Paenibacillus xylanilyticus]
MMRVYFILLMCIVLLGCSNTLSGDAQPDHIQKEDGGPVIATKQLGEYMLRFAIQKSDDHTFTFQPGLKYVGNDVSHVILHSKQVFAVDIQVSGETILPPRTTTSEGLTTNLTNEEWYTEQVEITLTRAQIQKLTESEGTIVLNAYFQSEQSGFVDEKRMILNASQVLLENKE